MARALAALVVSLLAVSGAGGADVQTPKRGGMVVIPGIFGGTREPACLSPFRGCGGVAMAHVGEVLEPAFDVGPGGVRPNLVTRAEFTRRPPYTLTYHIRPEARWSDGVAITARDFVFTHGAIRRFPQSPEIDADAHVTNVRSVRALDAKTVEVVLASRLFGWRGRLFGIVVPRHALLGEDLDRIWTDRIDNPKTGTPIGSGPFLVERWERGSRLVLRRNERFWGPHPAYLERLVIRFGIDDPLEALRSGGLDVYQVRVGLDLEAVRAFQGIRGLAHRFAPGIRWEHFEIRLGPGGHPALRNKLVRRALAYGIDRAALVRGVFGALRPKMQPADSAVFLPSSPYYRPNWREYRYRPAEARRLLEQAGCRRGEDGIYSCAGERLSLRFVTNTGVASRRRVFDLVPGQLRRAGIEARPTFAPGTVLVDQIFPSGDFDVALISFFYGADVAVDFAFRCQGPLNTTGYCQRLVTRELDQANRILDPIQYARALNRADVQMAKDVPVIPLWQEPSLAAFRSTLRGFVSVEPLIAWNTENWWLAR